ncbi:MAG: hypothetical protein V7629_10670 [Motiliproteus sp.]
MKTKFIVLIMIGILSAPVLAEKPTWTPRGKPTLEQRDVHKSTVQGKTGSEKKYYESEKKLKWAKEGRSDELKGADKQREKKADQVQNELGKGSDKGQESRETRKKWWKFWGES